MSIIIDLIVVGIIVLFAILSAKKGFVRTLIEVVGFVLVILFVTRVSPILANTTYDKFIEPTIISSFENITVQDNVTVEIPQLPKIVSTFLGNNFDLSNFQNIIEENISTGISNAVTTASQQVIKPVISNILSLLYTLIITIVLLFVVKILAKLLNKMFSFSIIGKANRVLGAILGVVKGIVIAMLFCNIISLILSFVPAGFLIFTPNAVDGSTIFKLLIL